MMKNALLLFLLLNTANCKQFDGGDFGKVLELWPKVLGPYPDASSRTELQNMAKSGEAREPVFFFVQTNQEPGHPIPVSEELHKAFQEFGVEFDVELTTLPIDKFTDEEDDILSEILSESVDFDAVELEWGSSGTSQRRAPKQVLGPASFHQQFVQTQTPAWFAFSSDADAQERPFAALEARARARDGMDGFNPCACVHRLADFVGSACNLIACIFENFLCPMLDRIPSPLPPPALPVVKAICFLIKNLGLFKCLCPFVACVIKALVELVTPYLGCEGSATGTLSDFGDSLWDCALVLIDCLLANIWAYIKSILCPWCGAASSLEFPAEHSEFLQRKFETVRDKVLRFRPSVPKLSYELEMFAVRYLEAHMKPLGLGPNLRKELLIKAHYDNVKAEAGLGLNADALECHGGGGNTCDGTSALEDGSCTSEGTGGGAFDTYGGDDATSGSTGGGDDATSGSTDGAYSDSAWSAVQTPSREPFQFPQTDGKGNFLQIGDQPKYEFHASMFARNPKALVDSGIPLTKAHSYDAQHFIDPNVDLKEYTKEKIHQGVHGFVVSSLEMQSGFWDTVKKLVCCFIPCAGCCSSLCGTKTCTGLDVDTDCKDKNTDDGTNGNNCRCCGPNNAECCFLDGGEGGDGGDGETGGSSEAIQTGAKTKAYGCCNTCRCKCKTLNGGVTAPCIMKACKVIKHCILSFDSGKCLAALCKGACFKWLCAITNALNCDWNRCWWMCFLQFLLQIMRAILACYKCLCGAIDYLAKACLSCSVICSISKTVAAKACKCKVGCKPEPGNHCKKPANVKHHCSTAMKTKYGFKPCELTKFLCLEEGITFLEGMLCWAKCCLCGPDCPVVDGHIQYSDECCGCQVAGCTCTNTPPTLPPQPPLPPMCTTDEGQCKFGARVCMKPNSNCEFGTLCRRCTHNQYPAADDPRWLDQGGTELKLYPTCSKWDLTCKDDETMREINSCWWCGADNKGCIDHGGTDPSCGGDVEYPEPTTQPYVPPYYPSHGGYGAGLGAALEHGLNSKLVDDGTQSLSLMERLSLPLSALESHDNYVPSGEDQDEWVPADGECGFRDDVWMDCNHNGHCRSNDDNPCMGKCVCDWNSVATDGCLCVKTKCLLPWCINQCDPSVTSPCFAKTNGEWTNTEHHGEHGVWCYKTNQGVVTCKSIRQCADHVDDYSTTGCCTDCIPDPPTPETPTCEDLGSIPCEADTDCHNIDVEDPDGHTTSVMMKCGDNGCCEHDFDRSTVPPDATQPPLVPVTSPPVNASCGLNPLPTFELESGEDYSDEYGPSSGVQAYAATYSEECVGTYCIEICDGMCETVEADCEQVSTGECTSDCTDICDGNIGIIGTPHVDVGDGDAEIEDVDVEASRRLLLRLDQQATARTKTITTPYGMILSALRTAHHTGATVGIPDGIRNMMKGLRVGQRLAALHAAGVPQGHAARTWSALEVGDEVYGAGCDYGYDSTDATPAPVTSSSSSNSNSSSSDYYVSSTSTSNSSSSDQYYDWNWNSTDDAATAVELEDLI